MKYIATINGKRYEVVVEKVSDYSSLDRNGVAAAPAPAVLPAAAPAAAPAPAPAPAAAPAPAPKAAPAPAPAPAPAAAPSGGANVEAPMPGKILKINVSAGQAVKFGQPIIIMEAMKMENEIVAPQDGTVAEIRCSVGDQVDTGAVLATLS